MVALTTVAEEMEKESHYGFILKTQPTGLAGDWKQLLEREDKDACKVFGFNIYGVGLATGRSRFGEKIESSGLFLSLRCLFRYTGRVEQSSCVCLSGGQRRGQNQGRYSVFASMQIVFVAMRQVGVTQEVRVSRDFPTNLRKSSVQRTEEQGGIGKGNRGRGDNEKGDPRAVSGR